MPDCSSRFGMLRPFCVLVLLTPLGCESPWPDQPVPVSVHQLMLELQHTQSARAYTLSGTFVCTACGRTEHQTWRGEELLECELEHDGHDYLQRFGIGIEADHRHDWFLESGFSTAPGNVNCTMLMVEGWFRALPRLRDRTAIDALYREAQTLSCEARHKLMSSIDLDVWLPHELDHVDLDAAFARWRERRSASDAPK